MESIGFTTPPSKRTYFLDYMGKVSIHRAYSKTMLRWLMAKLKFLRKPWFCALSIDKDGLTTRKQERVLINFSDPFSNQLVHTNGMPNNEIDSQKISHPLAVMDSVKELSVDADNSASELLPPGICYNEIIEVVSPTDYEKKCIGFMIDKGPSQPFALHVFQHESDAGLVKEIAETVKSFMSWFEKTTPSGCSCLISKNVKLEDLDSVRFEVMLLGKLQIKVEHSSSFNFVDEAVDKYHSLECQHAAAMEEFKMIENLSKESPDLPRANKLNEQQNISQSLIDGSREGAAEILLRKSSATWNQERRPSLDEGRQQRCNSMDMAAAAEMRQRTSRTRHCSEPATTAGMGFDKNKTRLFQVGRQAITLICTDQSVRNVEVPFTNIARHTKGVKHKDHFGVFAKDHSGHFQLHNHNAQKEDNKFKCFLFKCADEGVCDEIMQAMKQACHSCACGPDPMCTYHALCKRIHTMSGGNSDHSWIEKGTNLAAKCASNSLSEADQKRIKQKIEECYNDNPPESTYERLVVIMEMMRQVFEEKQVEHDLKVKQLRDPQSNAMSKKFTFLKSRAKKSLTSIESFWEKSVQKVQELQHEAEHHIQSPVERIKFFSDNSRSAPNTPISHQSSNSYQINQIHVNRNRHRSGSPASFTDTSPLAGSRVAKTIVQPEPLRPRNTVGSPAEGSINVRRKLNMAERNDDASSSVNQSSMSSSSARSSLNTTPMQSRSSTPDATPEKSITASARKLSFHQKIFNKVTTPVRKKNPSSKDAGSPNIDDYKRPLSKTPDQIRLAWRRAIQDQMMLNRINKVSSTVETFEAEATPSDKLNYAEPDPCSEEMTALWEELLETDGRDRYKIDKQVLHSAVKKGVPMRMRGKVWSFLYEQWKLRDIDSRHTSLSTFRLPSPPYEKLLRQLTPHHHAILIDLSRTYPSSSYFSKQLGPGQLSLYNILKAYSMLDTEVGYCQGLSFVAGLLLLHYHTPNEAFLVLRHLMADMGCRKLYLPDMNTLRIAIYQLSRLLHDFHNDLYTHFEDNDVTLMLFSAPWFLTMFTSVLSFGFVARIFDILFMEGISALFKAALCLLCHHKENILKEKGFENIVKYLKDNLPNMADDEVKQVLNDMFQLDIGEKLRVYEVEYAVLEDGDIFGNDENSEEKGAGGDLDQKYMRLEQAHQTVTKYNLELVEQLEAAKMQIKSLQQGLTDMASIDERRALQLEQLRQENQLLTNSH